MLKDSHTIQLENWMHMYTYKHLWYASKISEAWVSLEWRETNWHVNKKLAAAKTTTMILLAQQECMVTNSSVNDSVWFIK